MKRRRADDSAFWISYSDLATGLLLIFVLLLTQMTRAKHAEQQSMQAENAALRQQRLVFEDRNVKLLKLRDEVARLIGVHAQLSERLRSAVDKTNEEVGRRIFQFRDGEVYVSDQEVAWFKSNSAKLLPDAKRQIRIFYLNLYDALLRHGGGAARIEDHLASVTIEGHTDPLPIKARADKVWSLISYNGTRQTGHSEDSNFQLGQLRAKAIVDLIHDSYVRERKGFDDTRPWHVFFALVQASGRSWTRAYCEGADAQAGQPLTPTDIVTRWPAPCERVEARSDAPANRRSRRVTFSFELDTRGLLNRLRDTLESRAKADG